MGVTITIGKVVLAAALSLAGYEEPKQNVMGLTEDKAEAIVATLLSDDSRERFEAIVAEARLNGVSSTRDLDPERRAALKEIAEEAGSAIRMSAPLF